MNVFATTINTNLNMVGFQIVSLLTLFSLSGYGRAQPTAPTATPVTVDYTQITNQRGDLLPDFSFCGYHASADTLPLDNTAASQTLSPGKGDQAPQIQATLNQVAAAGGGVVLLNAGTFELLSGITIQSNTILRGSGVGMTTLAFTNPGSGFISIGNADAGEATTGVTTDITDTYVPVGTSNVNVASTDGFTIGQTVFVQRTASAAWIAANGMNDLVRHGQQQTWIKVGQILQMPRKIASISGNTITFDIPLSDSIDSTLDMAGQVVAYTAPAAASTEIGVEDLTINLNPSCSGVILNNTDCATQAIVIHPYTTDSWVRNVDLVSFNQFVLVANMALRITIENVTMHRTDPTDGGRGGPLDITIEGTQVLITGCSTFGPMDASSFSVGTGALVSGPNAVVNHYTQQPSQQIQPHQRWASGFLVDASNASLSFINRGTRGSGHGWTINAGVGWNVLASNLQVESPPTGVNYCIGCIGTPINKPDAPSNGTFIDPNVVVSPWSLFAAQLAARGISSGGT